MSATSLTGVGFASTLGVRVAIGVVVSMTVATVAWSGVAEGSVVGVATDDWAQALLRIHRKLSQMAYFCTKFVFIIICNAFSLFASILQYVVCMRCNTARVHHPCVGNWGVM